MEREQEQIIKEALNVGIEMCTREESEYAEENHELQHKLKTIDKAWKILFESGETNEQTNK